PGFDPRRVATDSHGARLRRPRERRDGLRVLVTGAAGFIGSAVVAQLRGSGYDVVATVRRRNAAARGLGATKTVSIDIARAIRVEAWLPPPPAGASGAH